MKNDCSYSLKVTPGNIFLEVSSFIYYCQSLCNFEETICLLKALLQLRSVSRTQKGILKYLLRACYVNNLKL